MPLGAVWTGAAPGAAQDVSLFEYISHECTGPHAYRATLAEKRFFLNGTVEAFAACEAGRWDPATRTRRGASSRAACPAADFADDEATYTDTLLESLPALGSPDAPCDSGKAVPAPAPAPAAEARAPAAAAAAAAALLAGLLAL